MYNVTFLSENGVSALFKTFKTFSEAVEFALTRPENSILEIKRCP